MSQSARLQNLTVNTRNVLRHMFNTATKHPYLTLGLAAGTSAAVAHHYSVDRRPNPAANPVDAPAPQQRSMVQARFSHSPMPAPTMEGLDTSSPAMVQPMGAGYENPNLVSSSMAPTNYGSVLPLSMPMGSGRMSGMQDMRQPQSRITNNIAINNL